MIVPDLNLLIYTYDKTSPHHTAAVKWWTACLNGREAVGLPDVVVFGFMRLTTNPRVFASPMTPVEASGIIGVWMERTMVQRLVASDDQAAETKTSRKGTSIDLIKCKSIHGTETFQKNEQKT